MPSRSLVVVRCSGAVVAGAWIAASAAGAQGARQPLQAPAQKTPAIAPVAAHPPEPALLGQYCVGCHNDKLKTGGLALDTVSLDAIGSAAPTWEKVLTKIRSGAMPPARMRRPDSATMGRFADWLEVELDRAAAARPNPGRVAVHRLNRTEYANAVRDLLDLEIDPRSILIDEDPAETGFNNTAGALTISPAFIERYISTARRVSRMAIGDPDVVAGFQTYKVSKQLVQESRTGDDLPFGSRGGIAVRHRFIVDGEYIAKIRLQGQLYQYLLGLGLPHPMDVRLNGRLLKRFTVGGDAPGRAAPESFAGDIPGDPEWEVYMHTADAGLEVKFQASAGTHVVAVSFAEVTPELEGVFQAPQHSISGLAYTERYFGNPLIETVSIGGPYDPKGPGETSSRRRVFVCRPKSQADEPGCARTILARLARSAYRRPVNAADVDTLVQFFADGRARGGFETRIQSALTRILVDPEFLIRMERDPAGAKPGAVYALDDLALASRLSFFLWSSIPDQELLDVAAAGKLRDPHVLERQVRRMFADGRSKALIDNFASQWLGLPKLRGMQPDPVMFPEFDENLREAFQEETRRFFDSQLRGDASIVDLLSADYTFVNERLARHYRIANVTGDSFRRVTFEGGERGGLLGQGSVLMVTSYPNRTSPVFRGKWVLENLLAAHPPPPPPNVEGLKENAPGKPGVSVRERLEEHRRNPACASCHAQMDPLGFSLEGFDGVGMQRRANEDGSPIDASGVLPDGTALNGIAGLRTFLLNQRERFVSAVTEKLLAYAIGRSVEYYDRPAIRAITREAAARNHRWSAIIEGIVRSVPFQMSIATSAPEATTPAAQAGQQVR